MSPNLLATGILSLVALGVRFAIVHVSKRTVTDFALSAFEWAINKQRAALRASRAAQAAYRIADAELQTEARREGAGRFSEPAMEMGGAQ